MFHTKPLSAFPTTSFPSRCHFRLDTIILEVRSIEVALYTNQAFNLLVCFVVILRGIAIQPFLNLTPNEQKFSLCGLKIVGVLFEFLFPHKVSNGAWCHLYPLA